MANGRQGLADLGRLECGKIIGVAVSVVIQILFLLLSVAAIILRLWVLLERFS